jgi:hypothetical protein
MPKYSVNLRQHVPSHLKKMLRTDEERFQAKFRKDMVLDLVSLREDSVGFFRKRFALVAALLDDATILQCRDQLRVFWAGDDVYQAARPQSFRFGALHSWLEQARQQPRRLWSIGTYADGTHSVSPDLSILPLALALAGSELSPKMGICENPRCPQKYFLKERKTQRFCDHRACSAYGQRQHKLKWWEAHKSELRPKSMSSRKPARKYRR